jgi:hypothetical protein
MIEILGMLLPPTYEERRRLRNRILICGGIVIAGSIILFAVYVKMNERDWLYDSDYQPIFNWVPDKYGPVIQETGERRPRNIRSKWA